MSAMPLPTPGDDQPHDFYHFSPILHQGETLMVLGVAAVRNVTPPEERDCALFRITYKPAGLPLVMRRVVSSLVLRIPILRTKASAETEAAAYFTSRTAEQLRSAVQDSDLHRMHAQVPLDDEASVLDAISCWPDTALADILTPQKPPVRMTPAPAGIIDKIRVRTISSAVWLRTRSLDINKVKPPTAH